MKKLFFTFVAVLFTLSITAQSDFDIAQSFMSKKGVKLVNNEHSQTRGSDVHYSIFNGENNKGFCIVVNGDVVGYDTDNTANENDIPCGLKEMLEMYYEIIPKTKTRAKDPDWWTPRDMTPIMPLIKTKWGQCSPYNDLLQKKTGICSVVAWAQIVHYFRCPQLYEEVIINDSVYLPITYFNHDKMLNKYDDSNKDNEIEEREEVAKLFYYTRNHSIDAHYTNELDKLWRRLGFEFRDFIGECINGHYNENFTTNFHKQHDILLEQGIPSWNCGRDHAYVVDGRDSEGRYHINFGWDGSSDGYYATPDIWDERTINNENITDGAALTAYACGFPYYIFPIYFDWTYTPTCINNTRILQLKNDGDVYNLQGMKVSNKLEGLPNGIYIKNKKKYIIN